jgi:membrane-bound lytic murein transglycosylase D
LPDISHAYVRKLHALSCLMEQADDREEWLRALDRPVPRLASVSVPDNVADIAGWAARNGQDAAQLQRLNPVFANGRIGRIAGARAPLLAIAPSAVGAVQTSMQSDTTGRSGVMSTRHRRTVSGPASVETAPASTRHHTVAKGESPWTIARLHRIGVADLMQRNGLANSSVLKPGMVLQVDLPPPASNAARVAE